MSDRRQGFVLLQDGQYSVEYDLPNRVLLFKLSGFVTSRYQCRKDGDQWSVKSLGSGFVKFATLHEAAGFVMSEMTGNVRIGQGEQW